VKLHPINECIEVAKSWREQGLDTYQQFLCAKCGEKNTVEEKNTFFAEGRCGDCGYVTNLRKTGCNYMASWSSEPEKRHGKAKA